MNKKCELPKTVYPIIKVDLVTKRFYVRRLINGIRKLLKCTKTMYAILLLADAKHSKHSTRQPKTRNLKTNCFIILANLVD